MSRPHPLSRPRAAALGALVLVLVAAPFVPRGGGDGPDDTAIRPAADRSSPAAGSPAYTPRVAETTGKGALTLAMKAEIDRVVGDTSTTKNLFARATGRLSTRAGALSSTNLLADRLVRCAVFEGQRYCLGTGWTEDSQAQVQSRVATSARLSTYRRAVPGQPLTRTGDLDADSVLTRAARLTPAARASHDRAELRDAARSVAKVILLRHEIEDVPLPTGFLTQHPEARAPTVSRAQADPQTSPSRTSTGDSTTAPVEYLSDYPRRRSVLDPAQTAEQARNYWCGPAAMQMITWGWKDKDKGAEHWADLLGTTSSGTAITDMLRVLNAHTGWDNKAYAGPYVPFDISRLTYKQWYLLIVKHIADYKAPVLLHPNLHKIYYPYLDHDGSGHFQVGRGYDKRGDKSDLVGYFEPWNQQLFHPDEPFIPRVQWRSAYQSYRANEDHFQHNIGV